MHRYYNPALSASEIEDLDWANYLTLQTVKVFLGVISENVLAVSIRPQRQAVTVRVAFRKHSAVDDEALDEALVDLAALIPGDAFIEHEIVLGAPDVHQWMEAGFRFVFLKTPD